jgi:hypothetical protein
VLDILAALDGRICNVGCLACLLGAAIWLLGWGRTRRTLGRSGHSAACASRWGESCSCGVEK